MGRGTLLAGRYRLDRPVGSDLPGAECWDARDQILDRPVRAVVLHEGRVAQAQDAARRAALVTDPRLLRVLDVGSHDDVPYVVTERITGRDLAQLTAHGPLPADQARAIIGEAAAALEVARRRGVHHLALRPTAVHVTEQGGVLVSGLGMDGELRGHGLGDARSTTRADTVGLVALLYLTVTGRWPAPAGTDPGTVPVAPEVGGRPVPPAEISPAVPNDLDTLCSVTLGPHDDGPHSPAELVRELEPWGPIAATEIFGALDAAAAWRSRTGVGTDDAVVTDAPGVHGADAPGAGDGQGTGSDRGNHDGVGPDGPDGPAAPVEPVGTVEPRVVQRQSVRGTLTGQPVPPPGTPPPATPAVIPPVVPPVIPPRAPRPAPVRGTAPAARPDAPARASSPAVEQPAGDSFDAIVGRSTEMLITRRFDPTPVVLALVVIAVVVGLVMAWNSLTRPAPPIGGAQGIDGLLSPSDAPPGQSEPEDDATPPDGQDPASTTAPEPPPSAVPAIVSGQQVDPPPDGDQNEHPELAHLAVDGDLSTVWISRTYASPTYGMKSGIGYAVTLAEPAVVSTVTLHVQGSGGNVEVRATDPATPTEGPVLASGPVGPGTVLTLEPATEATHIVLWFTELPQTPDGRNRVELAEVQVS